MASRNVALRMDAYRTLDAARRPGESFSDAVLRLAGGRKRVSEVVAGFAPLSPEESRSFERELRRVRRETEAAFRRRAP
jgi:predicted CopG family antitoxin